MGKDKDLSIKKEKKEKKDKKEKRASLDGVTKVKKEKKDKKEKKLKTNGDVADALEAELEKSPEVSMVKLDASGDVVMEEEQTDGELKGALVPFAFPLAEDAKEVKKILRTVKKCKTSKKSQPILQLRSSRATPSFLSVTFS